MSKFFLLTLIGLIFIVQANCQVNIPNQCYVAFRRKSLELVNAHRQKHQVQPLVANAKIERIAHRYSLRLARRARKPRNNPRLKRLRLSENLFYKQQKQAFDLSPTACQKYAEMAVNEWYKQSRNYNFKKNKPKWLKGKKHVSNFAHMVWASSQRVGFALSVSKKKRKNHLFIVANFNPRAQLRRKHFKRNIKPRVN